MNKTGYIKDYNGRYGIIESDDLVIDFDKKDILVNQELKVGDKVEFKVVEKKGPLLVACNINKLSL